MGLRIVKRIAGHWLRGLILRIDSELQFDVITNPEINSTGGNFIWKIITNKLVAWKLRDDTKNIDLVVVDTVNENITINGKLTVTGLIDPTGLVLDEQATAPASPVAGKGLIWVKDDIPNILRFSDDVGSDFIVPVVPAGAAITNNSFVIQSNSAGGFIDSALKELPTKIISSKTIQAPGGSIGIGPDTTLSAFASDVVSNSTSLNKQAVLVDRSFKETGAIRNVRALRLNNITAVLVNSDDTVNSALSEHTWDIELDERSVIDTLKLKFATAVNNVRVEIRVDSSSGPIVFENIAEDFFNEGVGGIDVTDITGETEFNVDTHLFANQKAFIKVHVLTGTVNLKGSTATFVPYTNVDRHVTFNDNIPSIERGTQKLTGTVNATTIGQTIITGNGTLFTSELAVGDTIFITSDPYEVIAITNNTSLTISPALIFGVPTPTSIYKMPNVIWKVDDEVNDYLTVTKEGNVGIGTLVPDEILHTADSIDGDFTGLLLENELSASASSVNETVQIKFGFGGNNNVGQIQIGKEDDYTIAGNENSFMSFHTDTAGALTEQMRITSSGQVGISNGSGNVPQYRLDVGNLSYFAINGNFAHIIQHNNAASTFWSIATRNGGNLDFAVTTTDPRPSSGTIGTSGNAISIKTNKDVEFTASVGIGIATVNAESLLELRSTTKALRLTEVTTTQRIAMTGASAFVVLDITIGSIFYHNGSAWIQL